MPQGGDNCRKFRVAITDQPVKYAHAIATASVHAIDWPGLSELTAVAPLNEYHNGYQASERRD
jgi:hypothetical protein